MKKKEPTDNPRKTVQRCNKTIEKLENKRQQYKEKREKKSRSWDTIADIFLTAPELTFYVLRGLGIGTLRLAVFLIELV